MTYNTLFASELPAGVMAYVMNGFPRQSIAYAEKGVTSTGIGYLVSLNDGTELVFNLAGTCNEVHRKHEDYLPILL